MTRAGRLGDASPLSTGQEFMADSLPFVSRDALKAAASAPTRTIEFLDIPGFGRVGILGLTGKELDDLYRWVNRTHQARKKAGLGKKPLGFRPFVLVRTLVNEQGERILTDADATDGWLDDLPAGTLSPAIKTAFRLNGIGKQEEGEAEEDEDEAAEETAG